MDILERYNEALRTSENGTISLLNRVLDSSFNRLVRRARIHMRAGYTDPAQRNLAVLQEFRQLVPVANPERADAYDTLFRRLVSEANTRGLSVADELIGRMAPGRSRVDVDIPIEATVIAANQARGYLRRHGESFAETAAAVIAQGVAEGRPTDAMVRDTRDRLSVVKSRAETIVRTESLRAYNGASNTYYAAQGIDEVFYYATSDDRTCPICTGRAGNIYKRGTVTVPLHPRCRCYLAPWNADIAQLDPNYAAMRKAHKEEVARYAQVPTSDLLSQRSVFESITPIPLSV